MFLLVSVWLIVFVDGHMNHFVLVQISEQVDADLGIGTFHLNQVEEIHFLTTFIIGFDFLIMLVAFLVLVVVVLLVIIILCVLSHLVTISC